MQALINKYDTRSAPVVEFEEKDPREISKYQK